MKLTKKLWPVLLLAALLLSLVPVGALAADDTAAAPAVVLTFSDFQASAGSSPDERRANSRANVEELLAAVKKDYPTADGLIFCGDLDYKLPTVNVEKSIEAVRGAVETAYPEMAEKQKAEANTEIFVQGNHDEVAQGTCGLAGTGPHDTAAYGVFVIDDDDYEYYTNGTPHTNTTPPAAKAKVEAVAARLDEYLAGKVKEHCKTPILVASHVPLHYSDRTRVHGDACNGKLLFDVLNSYGKKLNIVFIFGHDHSKGFDDFLGGAAICLQRGDSINIPVPDDKGRSKFTTETLQFTYMNAGYVGYYTDENSKDDNDVTLTMCVLTVSGDRVEIRRYDKDGLHDVKSEGFLTKISGGVVDWADKNVYASPVVCEAPAAFPVVWVCVGAAVLAAVAAVLIVRASRRKKTAAQ